MKTLTGILFVAGWTAVAAAQLIGGAAEVAVMGLTVVALAVECYSEDER